VLAQQTNFTAVSAIHLDSEGIVSSLTNGIDHHLGGLRGAVVREQNVVPVGSQPVSDGRTDASAASGHEGYRTAHEAG